MSISEVNINKDCKLIKILTASAKGERLDSKILNDANSVISKFCEDMSPSNQHKIAQVIAYSINDLQQNSLDFLNNIADIKNVGYGDKAAFRFKTGHIKAYYQAKGSTTARSMVGSKQILVDTEEISIRPAIKILDMQSGRINMSDVIREGYIEIENAKIAKAESVLAAAISSYSSPFYATGTGIVKETFDPLVVYASRLGPVTILGDLAAVQQLSALTGFQAATNEKQFSTSIIDEHNTNGYIGVYNGAKVVKMTNAYKPGTTETILNPSMLYVIPGGMSADLRNLKIVNEGGVNSISAQNIDDSTYDVKISQYYGAAFCVGELPTIACYKIN